MFDITVVIPCYNAGRWVRDALQSVSQQTYPAREVIVVDDGSDDDSVRQIINSDMGITLLHTPRINAAGARNVGVEAATCDWIAFLDADDVWYAHHLEQAVRLLQRGHDVAYLCHNDQLRCDVNEAGVFVSRQTSPPVDEPTAGLADEVFFSWWVRRAWFCTCSLVVERQAFLAAGGFDTSQRRRHDFEMFLRVVHGKTWAYNPMAGIAYRFLINPNCVSHDIVETCYYTLRGLVKNRGLYDERTMTRALKKWAAKTARSVVLSPTPKGKQRAWELCWPYLGPLQKCVYGLGRRSPRLVNGTRRLKKALVS